MYYAYYITRDYYVHGYYVHSYYMPIRNTVMIAVIWLNYDYYIHG